MAKQTARAKGVASELREKDTAVLVEEILSLKRELLNMRIKRAVDKVDNTARFRVARRAVARIKTVLHERKVAARSEGASARKGVPQQSPQSEGAA